MNLNSLAFTLILPICSGISTQSVPLEPSICGFDASSAASSCLLPSYRQEVGDEARKKLRHEFGFSFLVYRDKIQSELNLSSEQKEALDKHLREVAQGYISFLQSNEPRKTAEQQSEFEALRSKALADLESELKKTLSDSQQKRLSELVRQREGLFGGPSLWTGLDITDEEKSKFMAVIEPMHKKMEAAIAGAEHGGNPAEVQHQVLGLRADLEQQMEAILTDLQRQQWKQMLGKPIAVDALYDLSEG